MLQHEFIEIRSQDINILLDSNYQDIMLKYDIIVIPDEYVINNDVLLKGFQCDWTYIGNTHEGLAYTGISIIRNEQLYSFIQRIDTYKNHPTLSELFEMTYHAIMNNNIIIHYGI